MLLDGTAAAGQWLVLKLLIGCVLLGRQLSVKSAPERLVLLHRSPTILQQAGKCATEQSLKIPPPQMKRFQWRRGRGVGGVIGSLNFVCRKTVGKCSCRKISVQKCKYLGLKTCKLQLPSPPIFNPRRRWTRRYQSVSQQSISQSNQ